MNPANRYATAAGHSPDALVQARVESFRRSLQTRPERTIAVVGHGTFLRYLTGKSLANCEVARLA